MLDIGSMTPEEIAVRLTEMGQPAYRAGQIFRWIHSGTGSFDKMTDLPAALRQELEKKFVIYSIKIDKKLVSPGDNTVKYLYRLHDGETVESVVMHYKHGSSVCISSQVGCKMGCGFCATGLGGFTRNLTASEMLAQIMAAKKDLSIDINHAVLMGMGEPLDNFEALSRFLTLVSHPQGLAISRRHISVSTCGLVDGIYKLMETKPQCTLSVSLHAPDDELRSRLMPVNRRWNIKELLDACRRFTKETGRRVSFEYALIKDLNDAEEQAVRLAALLRGMKAHLNLIPMNAVKETPYRKSDRKRIMCFFKVLTNAGINVTIRRTLGADIGASCGQLRGKSPNNTDI